MLSIGWTPFDLNKIQFVKKFDLVYLRALSREHVMARKRATPKQKTSRIDVNENANAKAEKLFKCDHTSCKNRRPFSSLSNLNNHRKIKHEGGRWICPFCKSEQSSKYSQKRHIQRRHKKIYTGNLDENEFQILPHKVQMTEKTKDALLAGLVEKVSKQDKIIAELKQKLIGALKENAVLKGNSGEVTYEGEYIIQYSYLTNRKILFFFY